MSHRAHDYWHLVQRWRAVARAARVPLRRLVKADGYDQFYLRTPALAEVGGIYISAGIHGDEPAGPEAMLVWAEQHAKNLRELPLLLLPCMNPWGLVQNRRTDAENLDLNRMFHRDDHAVIRAVKTLVTPYRFAAAAMLHEDYDGQGVYLYEIHGSEPYWGEAFLKAASTHLPIDPRGRIDGRKITDGIYRRKVSRKRFERMGFPEAVWLFLEHSPRSFTIETPSEFAFEKRVAAQVAMIEECVRKTAALGS